MMRAMIERLVKTSVSTGSGLNLLGCWMCRQSVPQILYRSSKNYSSFSTSKIVHPNVVTSTNMGLELIGGGKHLNQPLLSPSFVSVFSKQQLVTSRIGDRGFKSSAATSKKSFYTPRDETTLWGRTLKKLGFTSIPKSILRRSGVLMYMKLADELDYLKFFKGCNLPDTFASWFIVLELHIWLLSARLMQEGREGREVRNAMLKGMWEDLDIRSKKMEGALPAARRKDIKGLGDQFQAVMMGYDEGLLGDDKILAGALWRRFIRLDIDPPALLPDDFNSPEKHGKIAEQVKALEMLVIFVRSQYLMLNGISTEPLLRTQAFNFAPFDDSLYQLVDNTNNMEKYQIRGAKKVEASRTR